MSVGIGRALGVAVLLSVVTACTVSKAASGNFLDMDGIQRDVQGLYVGGAIQIQSEGSVIMSFSGTPFVEPVFKTYRDQEFRVECRNRKGLFSNSQECDVHVDGELATSLEFD